MKKIAPVLFSLALLGGALFPAHVSAKASVAGDFDYYVLALSVQPLFCQSHPQKKECQLATQQRNAGQKLYMDDHLTLHGLWPNRANDPNHRYGYCNVSSADQNRDKNASAWSELPPLKLKDDIRKELTTVMPGIQSYLQRHEWYKHGSCTRTTIDPNIYFKQAIDLAHYFANGPFNDYLAQNQGRTLNKTDILQKFDDVYTNDGSEKASTYLLLQCQKFKGTSYLSAISIYLSKQVDVHQKGHVLLFDPRYTTSHERSSCSPRISIYQP